MQRRLVRAATGFIVGGTLGAAGGIFWCVLLLLVRGGFDSVIDYRQAVGLVGAMALTDAATGALVALWRRHVRAFLDGWLIGLLGRFLLAPVAGLLWEGADGTMVLPVLYAAFILPALSGWWLARKIRGR